jgi:hypothetical protein
VKIYCAQHRENHHLTPTQTEQLIYGLSAHLCDEEIDPSNVFTAEDPFRHLAEFCVLSELNLSLDGEGYREHVLNMQESRHDLQSPPFHARTLPECPACGTWVCGACGWRRVQAARHSEQYCHRCHGTNGTFLPKHHTDRATREDHADAFLRAQQKD